MELCRQQRCLNYDEWTNNKKIYFTCSAPLQEGQIVCATCSEMIESGVIQPMVVNQDIWETYKKLADLAKIDMGKIAPPVPEADWTYRPNTSPYYGLKVDTGMTSGTSFTLTTGYSIS